MNPPIALTIAGSDSAGCAGIQADLRTWAALGVHGASALACVTAQNTYEVREVFALPPVLVRSQVEAVLDDLAVAATKTGLLVTEATIKEVAALAAHLPPLVVDPVISASSGRRMVDEAAIAAYCDHLLPCATVVTPNLPEAGALLGRELRTLEDARSAARQLGQLTEVVVVKGGHIEGERLCIDVVWDGRSCWELERPRVPTRNTHGSGCTFSAAVAAGLARGMQVSEAVRLANEFVHKAIKGGADWRVGTGDGPLDHFGWKEEK